MTDPMIPRRGLEAATAIGLALYVADNVAATAVSFPAGQVSDRLGVRGPLGSARRARSRTTSRDSTVDGDS